MFQQTIVVGNVGRNPELRYLQNGTAVCDFSVATTRRYSTNNNEMREETTWFKVTCWRQLAETVAQYVTTGRQVMVVGEIKASAYLDKSGQPAASLELTAREVKFLGSREGAGGEGGGNNSGGGGQRRNFQEDDFAPPPQRVDDIPF
jgi:single-strand DNA-binding protein